MDDTAGLFFGGKIPWPTKISRCRPRSSQRSQAWAIPRGQQQSLLTKTPMDGCKAISSMSVDKGNGTRTKYGRAVLSSRLACLPSAPNQVRFAPSSLWPPMLKDERASFWGQPSGACLGWSAMDISPPSRFDNLSAPPSMIVPPMPVPCRVRHAPFDPDRRP